MKEKKHKAAIESLNRLNGIKEQLKKAKDNEEGRKLIRMFFIEIYPLLDIEDCKDIAITLIKLFKKKGFFK